MVFDDPNVPLEDLVNALVADRDHWKANHDQQVRLKRDLHERYEAERARVAMLEAALREMLNACANNTYLDKEWASSKTVSVKYEIPDVVLDSAAAVLAAPSPH